MHAISSIIEQLKENETEKKKLGEKLSKMAEFVQKDNEIHENNLVVPVGDFQISEFTMAGIDGGLIKKELHGIDIILSRASSVFFKFKENKLNSHFSIPKNRSPEIMVLNSLDNRSSQIQASIFRVEKEINIAIKSTEHNPNIILLDGSILPAYLEDSENKEQLKALLKKYEELYKLCLEKGIILCGIIEDSRGTRFSNILSRKIPLDSREKDKLSRISDTSLLHYILKPGERTCLFNYYSEGNNFKKFDLDFLSFYIKNVKGDIPLRVEFLGLKNFPEEARILSSIIYHTSKFNSNYGIPPVLIEADQRAKLTQNDVDIVCSSIFSKLGFSSSVRDLRRNRRPF